MRILKRIQGWMDGLIIGYLRRKVLNRKLEGLADPTFLDRALAGKDDA